MNQRHWQEIESILDRILAIDNPQNIKEILNRTCKGDPDLYKEVANLLENIKEADRQNFLENSPFYD